MQIKAVIWDIDNVWYNGISTGHMAEKSAADPGYVLKFALANSWLSQDDADRWVQEHGKIVSARDLSRMFEDFFYRMQRNGRPLMEKKHVIKCRHMLLKGITIRQIKEAADSVPLNPGLGYAVDAFRRNGLHQAAFSDGLGPFVLYLAGKFGMDYAESVPAIVLAGGEEKLFEPGMLDDDSVELTGKSESFDKAKALFAHLKKRGYKLDEVAVIDDSGANVETILATIRSGGGIAVGCNPTESHRPIFQKHSIPVLKGKDLRRFAEIVLDPSKIKRYCE